ncbi:MAG: hypothetical protein K6E95_07410 [Lachnospiraceae bacterium]|nr:hypothetical protein [Lachnospiraceae bacterium]
MIDITKIALNIEQIFGGNSAVISRITPAKKYIDGKPTEEIEAYKVEAIAIANRTYDRVCVKVSQRPELSQDQIDAAVDPIQISFEGFEARIYKNFRTNTYELTCKAKSLQVIGNKKQ